MNSFVPRAVRTFLCVYLAAGACVLRASEADSKSRTDGPRGSIRFAYAGNFVPVSFLDRSGEAAGIIPDLIRWMADRNGFRAEMFPATPQQMREGLLSGTYDAAVFSSRHPQDPQFLYTPSIMGFPVSVFVQSGSPVLELTNGLCIALESGSQSFLDVRNIGYKELPCQSLDEMIDAVFSRRADALLCGDQPLLYYCYAMNYAGRFRKLGSSLNTETIHFATRADQKPLYNFLSKNIEEARQEGVVQWISRNWLGSEYAPIGFQIIRHIRYIVLGVIVLLAAVLLFWIWDIRLARRVLHKTEQLRSSEERLRTVFQNSPDAIYIEDEKGTVLDGNPAACAFHEMSREELIGRNVLDLVPPECRGDVERDFRKWFTGDLKRYEGFILAADGRRVPVEVIGSPLRFEGKIAVLLLVRDMTERRRSELALKESEMRYRGLIEAQSNFIIRTDTAGLFTFVNEAFCRFVGQTRADLIGTDSRLYIYYDDANLPAKAAEALISRRERVVTLEYRMRARNRVAWVQWEDIAVFDEAGRVVEIQSVGHDITDRRRIYEALQESEKRLRFLFEEIPHIAVQGYNAAREVMFWNRASEHLYKYSKKDALGKKMEDLVLMEDRREELVKAFDAWIKTGTPIPAGEMMKRTADGRFVTVYSSRLSTRNQRGEWEMYVIDVDLSELKRASEELVVAKEYAERANRAKSEFLANMSHEIRTPMNGVMGMTSLLLETQLTAEQSDSIQTIMESTKELMHIIDELLDISRIEAGEVRFNPEIFDLRETVEKVILLFADRAGRKGVDLSVSIHETVPEKMIGDSGRIRQILINLIGNALKFTHEGHIRIDVQAARLESGEWDLTVAVKDTGIGMTPELQERIFDKFTQGDSSSKREYGGTGLGLAITRQLVRLMGGEITVLSEPDKGTTFRFNLKVGYAADSSAETPSPAAPVADTAVIDADILLVEDNMVNQKVATAMLKKLGCRVTVVPNGARALEQIALRRFDLIFMDCQMPVMDGFEATKAIRQMVGEIRDIPIVAMTAHALKEDRQRCLDVGMDDYLSKPVHRDSLIAVLKKYCGTSTAVQIA